MNIKTTLTIGAMAATLMLAACGGGADVAKGPNSEARIQVLFRAAQDPRRLA